MPRGKMEGYALKVPIIPADHTYVKSNHGHFWPCGRRFKGGKRVCSGSGNTDQANCLARPNSRAGIVYATTGVCHQMANRILWPSGKMVSRASGYMVSHFFWGTYGIDRATGNNYSPPKSPWPELDRFRWPGEEEIGT